MKKYLCYQAQVPQAEQISKMLNSGACFGLSVCHAAMNLIGRLPWYEAALVALAEWDGEQSSLNNEILLPMADGNRPVKLGYLFFRIFNYIVFEHNARFLFPTFIQQDVLNPAKALFKILDQNDHAYFIQHRETVAGYFSELQLGNYLRESFMKNAMCILGNGEHAISLSYHSDSNQWWLYNANYDNKSIHQVFLTRHEALNEVIRILGNSINIQLAYLTKPAVLNVYAKEFERLVKIKKCGIIRERGLHLLLLNAAHLVPVLLETLKNDDRAPSELLRALTTKNKDGSTGIQLVLHYAAEYLPEFLGIIKSQAYAPALINTALNAANKRKWTGWMTMTHYAPEHANLINNFIQSKTHHSSQIQMSHSLCKR